MTAILRPLAAFALLKSICHDPHQSGSRWMALSLVAFQFMRGGTAARSSNFIAAWLRLGRPRLYPDLQAGRPPRSVSLSSMEV
jgi:hypothetical protein